MMSSTNGTHTTVVPEASIELMDRVARYRTGLVALLAMIKREGGWRSTDDQMLLREIERLLDEDTR